MDMNVFSLKQKVALVSGGSYGIGFAICYAGLPFGYLKHSRRFVPLTYRHFAPSYHLCSKKPYHCFYCF